MSKIHLNPGNDIHTPSVCHIGYIRGTDIRIVEYRSLAILITILIPCALLIQKRAEEDGGIGIGSAVGSSVASGKAAVNVASYTATLS